MERSAEISECGRFRWTLVRRWDPRPMLVAIMFNPSDADHTRDDPTISLLSFIASWNGFGGMSVMNLCPLRGSTPAPARYFLNQTTIDTACAMAENMERIAHAAAKAPDVLVAWGALAEGCDDLVERTLAALRRACPHARLHCLGRTAAGHPIHPLARGKLKVPKDRKFINWRPEP